VSSHLLIIELHNVSFPPYKDYQGSSAAANYALFVPPVVPFLQITLQKLLKNKVLTFKLQWTQGAKSNELSVPYSKSGTTKE